jgi:hypothetical protein
METQRRKRKARKVSCSHRDLLCSHSLHTLIVRDHESAVVQCNNHNTNTSRSPWQTRRFYFYVFLYFSANHKKKICIYIYYYDY